VFSGLDDKSFVRHNSRLVKCPQEDCGNAVELLADNVRSVQVCARSSHFSALLMMACCLQCSCMHSFCVRCLGSPHGSEPCKTAASTKKTAAATGAGT
jgi:hypothetical protein